jgi:hypothetical protein
MEYRSLNRNRVARGMLSLSSRLVFLLGLVVLLVSSCIITPPVPASVTEPGQPVIVEASPRDLTLLAGDTARISAAVHQTDDPRISFHSPAPSIATVDSVTGVVRGLRPGSTFIVVTSVADLGVQDTVRVRVRPAYRQIYGVVFDQHSRPVPDVGVELRTKAETKVTRTSIAGTFEFNLDHGRSFPWWLEVMPPAGYDLPKDQENPRQIRPLRDPTRLTILLRSEESAPGEQPTPPVRDNSPVQTDSLIYTLEYRSGVYEAEAVARYVNRTAGPVYFDRCMPHDQKPMYGLVPAEDRQKRPVLGMAWACVGGVPPGSVAPGDSIHIPVWLGSLNAPYSDPPTTMADRTGCFRLLLRLVRSPGKDSDRSELLPEEQRRSNIFCVRSPL